jgi:hypothetical protein
VSIKKLIPTGGRKVEHHGSSKCGVRVTKIQKIEIDFHAHDFYFFLHIQIKE